MRPGWLNGGAVGALAVLALLLAMPSQSAAYCDPLRAPWVERQLRELPKIRLFPANGQLIVGKRLVIERRGVRGDIVIQGGPVGYVFGPRFPGRISLSWRVAIRVVRLKPGARGEEEETVAFRRRSIGPVLSWTARRDPLIGVRVPDERGLFRVDLFIRNRHGKFLGKISRYLIGVVERFVDVRLATDRAVYAPGDVVWSEIENIGTQRVSFEGPLFIERKVDGEWVSVVNEGLLGRFEGLEGGQIGGCTGTDLPKDAPTGSYRGIVFVAPGRLAADIPTIMLTAPFRVE